MSALSITAANVAWVSGTKNNAYNAGAAITAGQAVYLDSATSTWKLADADASAATADCVGIALNTGVSGQPMTVQTDGTLTIGATMTLGEVYFLGTGAGGIIPAADLANPARTTIIGVATSTTVLTLRIYYSGVVHA